MRFRYPCEFRESNRRYQASSGDDGKPAELILRVEKDSWLYQFERLFTKVGMHVSDSVDPEVGSGALRGFRGAGLGCGQWDTVSVPRAVVL